MTRAEFLAELCALNQTWGFTWSHRIRNARNECPICAVANAHPNATIPITNSAAALAARVIGLSGLDAQLIIAAADRRESELLAEGLHISYVIRSDFKRLLFKDPV